MNFKYLVEQILTSLEEIMFLVLLHTNIYFSEIRIEVANYLYIITINISLFIVPHDFLSISTNKDVDSEKNSSIYVPGIINIL